MSENQIDIEQADKLIKKAAKLYLDIYDTNLLKIEINLNKNQETCKLNITEFKSI